MLLLGIYKYIKEDTTSMYSYFVANKGYLL